MAIEKVKEFFRQYGMEDRIREFEVSSATVELAAAALGCEPCRIAKTLSFMTEEGPVLIVAAGDAKIDNTKYKAQFHTKAKMLTPDEAVKLVQRTGRATQNMLVRQLGIGYSRAVKLLARMEDEGIIKVIHDNESFVVQ